MKDTQPNQVKFDALVEFTQELMEKYKVPGVAIGLVCGEETYTAGLGVTSIENPLDVTPQTLFQIGSTTKTITATLITQLAEQDKLSLDDRLRKFIPDFKVQDEGAAENVTLRQLLNHTAGWQGDIFAATGAGDDALEKYVSKMAEVPQQTPLGAVYSYNNASFNIAGRVIEVVTGKTYEAAVHEMLLEPLGMDNSFFFLDDVIIRRFAVGHILNDDKLSIGRPYALSRSARPSGGLISDVVDQMKYARFHMGDGTTASGERLMSPKAIQDMQTPTFSSGGDGKIGLAWHIGEEGGVKFVSHGGSTVGQQSEFWMAPAEQLAMTVFTNQDGGTIINEKLTQWVCEHFLGVVETPPEPKLLPAEELVQYAGDYVMSPTGDIFNFEPQEGRLIMSHTIGDYTGIFETPPDPYPPMRAAIYKTDGFLIIDDPFKGAKGEFLRDQDGAINWIRFGGRILRKQEQQ